MPAFKSKFEANVFKALTSNKKEAIEVAYESTTVPYVLEKNYTPDFTLLRPDGTILHVESKGKFDLDSRQKMLAVKSQHPDINLVMLFMRDQPLHKGSKTLYSDWCKKHDFEFAVACVPVRWLLGSKTPKRLLEKEIPIAV